MSHGYLPYGIGWYRKHFSVPASAAGMALFLEFDGVMVASEVYLNGVFLGGHASGYTPFAFALAADALAVGGDNVLAVKADATNPDGERAAEFRWRAIEPLAVAREPRRSSAASRVANSVCVRPSASRRRSFRVRWGSVSHRERACGHPAVASRTIRRRRRSSSLSSVVRSSRGLARRLVVRRRRPLPARTHQQLQGPLALRRAHVGPLWGYT